MITEKSQCLRIILILYAQFVACQYQEGYNNPFQSQSDVRPNKGNLFVKIGKLANGLSYGHISLSVNLTRLETRISHFRNATENLRKELRELDKTTNLVSPQMKQSMIKQISQMVNWLEIMIKETELKLKTIREALEPETYSGHPRHRSGRAKRQAAFGGGLLFGGIIGSLFTGFGLKTLTSVIERKQDVLATQIEEHEMLIHRSLDDIVKLNTTLAHVISEVRSQVETRRLLNDDFMSLYSAWFITEDLRDIQTTIDGLIAAHHGHFSHELVKADALQRSVNELRSKALHKGRELAIQTYADCFGLPTSYLYDTENKTIHLVLHLPMYSISNNLELYTYVPTPVIWQNGSTDTPFVEITSEESHIAISSDRTMYRTFTTDQLEDCMKLSDTHFCQDLAVFKIQRPSCLLGLFLERIDQVREHCNIHTHIASSKVVRLNESTYAIMSPYEDNMSISCQGNDRQSKVFKGTTFVDLEPGCTVNTKEIKILRAEYEPPIKVEALLVGYQFEVEDLIPDHSPEALERLFEMRKQLGSVGTDIPINDLKGLIAFQERYHGITAQAADIATPVIVTVVLVFIIVLICCCCWIRNPKCSDSILHRSHNARIADIERRYSAQYTAGPPIIKVRNSVDNGRPLRRAISVGDINQFDEYDQPLDVPPFENDDDTPPHSFLAERGAKPKRLKSINLKNGSVKKKKEKTTDVVSFPVVPLSNNAILNMPYTITNPHIPGKIDAQIQKSANDSTSTKPSAPPQDVADLWVPRKVQNVNPYENVNRELDKAKNPI